MTRYHPAKILVLALSEFGHDKTSSTVLQAAKFYYIKTLITKWFWHWKKLPVTIIIFWQF